MTESTGSHAKAPSRGRALCTFAVGDRSLGLDVALVGEVVTVDAVATVPMANAAVLGLFNLRGTPVPLVELGAVLGIDDATRRDAKARVALVLRHDELLVGFPIDRMEAVVPAERGVFTEPGTQDHPAVEGFMELADGSAPIVTVLAPAFLLERLEAVRFVKAEEK